MKNLLQCWHFFVKYSIFCYFLGGKRAGSGLLGSGEGGLWPQGGGGQDQLARLALGRGRHQGGGQAHFGRGRHTQGGGAVL